MEQGRLMLNLKSPTPTANRKGEISNEVVGILAAVSVAVAGAIVHMYSNFVSDKEFKLIYDRLERIEIKLDEIRSGGR